MKRSPSSGQPGLASIPDWLTSAVPTGRTHLQSNTRFGDVPLIEMMFTPREGPEWSGWIYDPTFAPSLPAGAVGGDVRQQKTVLLPGDITGFQPLGLRHVPDYYYLDQEKVCVECDRQFLFSAAEQKYWYETLHFSRHSEAIRCVDCRRDRRHSVATNTTLGEAVRAMRRSPDDPATLVALAQATSAHFQTSAAGNLDRAIAACRRARELNSELHESWYWEAACQEHAGRPARALDAYETFLETAKSGKQVLELKEHAKERIAALGCTEAPQAAAQ